MVGGTGLYLRAALSSIELRPPVPDEVREQVERELSERGAAALHAEISPAMAAGIHPNDRKRVARTVELERAGLDPAPSTEGGGELWTASLRHPTLLAGIVLDSGELAARIDARVERMVAEGAVEEARAVQRTGASRTAGAALGLDAADLRRHRRREGAPPALCEAADDLDAAHGGCAHLRPKRSRRCRGRGRDRRLPAGASAARPLASIDALREVAGPRQRLPHPRGRRAALGAERWPHPASLRPPLRRSVPMGSCCSRPPGIPASSPI